MGSAEKSYVWGIKRVLGSNCLIKDLKDQQDKKCLQPSLVLSEGRAQFSIPFGKKEFACDSELMAGFILEYICFLCQKDQNSTYEDLSEIAAKFVASGNKLCISVCFVPHCYLSRFLHITRLLISVVLKQP